MALGFGDSITPANGPVEHTATRLMQQHDGKEYKWQDFPANLGLHRDLPGMHEEKTDQTDHKALKVWRLRHRDDTSGFSAVTITLEDGDLLYWKSNWIHCGPDFAHQQGQTQRYRQFLFGDQQATPVHLEQMTFAHNARGPVDSNSAVWRFEAWKGYLETYPPEKIGLDQVWPSREEPTPAPRLKSEHTETLIGHLQDLVIDEAGEDIAAAVYHHKRILLVDKKKNPVLESGLYAVRVSTPESSSSPVVNWPSTAVQDECQRRGVADTNQNPCRVGAIYAIERFDDLASAKKTAHEEHPWITLDPGTKGASHHFAVITSIVVMPFCTVHVAAGVLSDQDRSRLCSEMRLCINIVPVGCTNLVEQLKLKRDQAGVATPGPIAGLSPQDLQDLRRKCDDVRQAPLTAENFAALHPNIKDWLSGLLAETHQQLHVIHRDAWQFRALSMQSPCRRESWTVINRTLPPITLRRTDVRPTVVIAAGPFNGYRLTPQSNTSPASLSRCVRCKTLLIFAHVVKQDNMAMKTVSTHRWPCHHTGCGSAVHTRAQLIEHLLSRHGEQFGTNRDARLCCNKTAGHAHTESTQAVYCVGEATVSSVTKRDHTFDDGAKYCLPCFVLHRHIIETRPTPESPLAKLNAHFAWRRPSASGTKVIFGKEQSRTHFAKTPALAQVLADEPCWGPDFTKKRKQARKDKMGADLARCATALFEAIVTRLPKRPDGASLVMTTARVMQTTDIPPMLTGPPGHVDARWVGGSVLIAGTADCELHGGDKVATPPHIVLLAHKEHKIPSGHFYMMEGGARCSAEHAFRVDAGVKSRRWFVFGAELSAGHRPTGLELDVSRIPPNHSFPKGYRWRGTDEFPASPDTPIEDPCASVCCSGTPQVMEQHEKNMSPSQSRLAPPQQQPPLRPPRPPPPPPTIVPIACSACAAADERSMYRTLCPDHDICTSSRCGRQFNKPQRKHYLTMKVGQQPISMPEAERSPFMRLIPHSVHVDGLGRQSFRLNGFALSATTIGPRNVEMYNKHVKLLIAQTNAEVEREKAEAREETLQKKGGEEPEEPPLPAYGAYATDSAVIPEGRKPFGAIMNLLLPPAQRFDKSEPRGNPDITVETMRDGSPGDGKAVHMGAFRDHMSTKPFYIPSDQPHAFTRRGVLWIVAIMSPTLERECTREVLFDDEDPERGADWLEKHAATKSVKLRHVWQVPGSTMIGAPMDWVDNPNGQPGGAFTCMIRISNGPATEHYRCSSCHASGIHRMVTSANVGADLYAEAMDATRGSEARKQWGPIGRVGPPSLNCGVDYQEERIFGGGRFGLTHTSAFFSRGLPARLAQAGLIPLSSASVSTTAATDDVEATDTESTYSNDDASTTATTATTTTSTTASTTATTAFFSRFRTQLIGPTWTKKQILYELKARDVVDASMSMTKLELVELFFALYVTESTNLTNLSE